MKNGNTKKKLDGNSFLLVVTIVLFFVMYIVGILMFGGRGFAKVQNFLNLFISNAGLIVVATGMTIVMITGGIDISVGSVVAMVCMMLAWMMEKGGIGAVPAIIIVLLTGCVFVAFYGLQFQEAIQVDIMLKSPSAAVPAPLTKLSIWHAGKV